MDGFRKKNAENSLRKRKWARDLWRRGLLIGFFACPGFASASVVVTFCEDPYAFVCGTTNDSYDEAKTVDAMKNVLIRVYSRIAEQGADGSWIYPELSRAPPDKSPPTKAQALRNARYMRVLEEEMFREMKITTRQWREAMQESREDLMAAVRQSGTLTASAKLMMIDRLKTIRILTPSEFASSTGEWIHPGDYFGRDGLQINAFYFPSMHALTLVPGFFFYGIARAVRPSPTVILNFFRQVATHEMGHSIDGSKFPKAYGRMKACVSDHFRHELPRDRYFHFFEGSVSDEQMKHSLGEISADYWAVQAVTESFRRRGYDAKRAIGELRRSFGLFCSSPEKMAHGDAHPGARFRIGLSMGRDAGLRRFLGCKPQPQRAPGCGLNGAAR